MGIIMFPPLGLVITEFTEENIITVLCCYVTLKIALLCSLVITLITRILDTFVDRLNMSLKTILLCSLIITLITRILDTFMFRLNMYLKITL